MVIAAKEEGEEPILTISRIPTTRTKKLYRVGCRRLMTVLQRGQPIISSQDM